MRFPLNEKVISGYRFGQTGLNGKIHEGCDYRADYVPLFAPCDGIIVRSGSQPSLAGNYIILRSTATDPIEFHFYHLSEILIGTGTVKEGQQIGVTGATGLVKGPHLHLECWRDGKPFDPETVQWDNKPMIKIQILEAGATFPLQEVKDYFAQDGVSLTFFLTLIVDPLTTVNVTTESAGTYPAVDMGPLEKYRHGADILFLAYHTDTSTHPSTYLSTCQWPDGTGNNWPAAEFCTHELLHALCYITGVKDTVHQLAYADPRPEAQYHVLIKQLKPYLLGTSTQTMTLTLVQIQQLYALAFYRDATNDELAFWNGRTLDDWLKTAIHDRSVFLAKQ